MKARSAFKCAALVSQDFECGTDFTFSAKDGTCACTPLKKKCEQEFKENYDSYRIQGNIRPNPLHRTFNTLSAIAYEQNYLLIIQPTLNY